MKIKKLSIIALVLSFVLLISFKGLSPVNAREQQPKGALISSSSGKEFAEVAEALAPKISPLKYSRLSSKPVGALRFACDPSCVEVSQYEGGTIANCKKKDLEVSDTDSALVEIKSGAARAPHWHDTWEQQTLISGKAKTYLIDEKGRVNVEVLMPGMVAFLPAGMTHWTETVGTQTAILSLSFPAGFKTFELGDSLIQVRKIDKNCAASSNSSCNAKPKSPILIIKDGLI
jgi:hypothetical protein